MNAPLDILAALASYGAQAVIEQGRVRLVCSKDHPPPAELIEAARALKEELHDLLVARRGRFEERAAYDEGLSRAEAEEVARRELKAHDGCHQHEAIDPSKEHPLAALRACCPEYIDAADWQQAVEDGCRFVSQWGGQAEALGWTDADLFALHTPPAKPAPSYRRLSRYDCTGLIWLLQGRPVIELTETAATIRAHSGATLTYRKINTGLHDGAEGHLRRLNDEGGS